MIEQYGLNDPFHVQYGRWIGNIMTGNLGWSETARQPVSHALTSLLPATLELVLLAFIPSFLLAIYLGSRAGIYLNKWPDHLIRIFTILGWSFPVYVFGLLMLLIFIPRLTGFRREGSANGRKRLSCPRISPDIPAPIPLMRSSMAIFRYSGIPSSPCSPCHYVDLCQSRQHDPCDANLDAGDPPSGLCAYCTSQGYA